MEDIGELSERVIENPDSVSNLKEKEIEELIEKIKKPLHEENSLVELQQGTTVFVGDTHGDFETTKSIVKNFGDENHIVFLGDYIDRAPRKYGSIYNLTYLLFLKYKYPQKIILLKGNHESNYLLPCSPYRFKLEIKQKFDSTQLHDKFVEAFSLFPLMVTVNNIFAAHGGIIKNANLDQLRSIDKNDRKAVEKLVWSDPTVSPTFRGAGDPFNKKDLDQFLGNINANLFIRGHDYNTLGFSIYGDRCLTIFSSSRYKEKGNGGILVAKAENKVSSISDLEIKDFSTGKWIPYTVKSK